VTAAPVAVQAFLAESVAVADGRLFVQGAGLAHLQVPEIPVHVGRIGLAVLLSVPVARTGEQIPLSVHMEGPDGTPIGLSDAGAEVAGGVSGSLVAGPAPEGFPLDAQLVPLAFNFDGLTLDQAGAYAAVIRIDGSEAARVAFGVAAA
jgi:hypothetical protein